MHRSRAQTEPTGGGEETETLTKRTPSYPGDWHPRERAGLLQERGYKRPGERGHYLTLHLTLWGKTKEKTFTTVLKSQRLVCLCVQCFHAERDHGLVKLHLLLNIYIYILNILKV